jgi:hypothetical protein
MGLSSFPFPVKIPNLIWASTRLAPNKCHYFGRSTLDPGRSVLELLSHAAPPGTARHGIAQLSSCPSHIRPEKPPNGAQNAKQGQDILNSRHLRADESLPPPAVAPVF